jgi:hypothetical protein
MASDRVVINHDQRARKGGNGLPPGDGSALSEDAIASAFVARHGSAHRHVAPRKRCKWDGRRWIQDSAGNALSPIHKMLHQTVSATEDDRSTPTAVRVASSARSAKRATLVSA